MDPRYIKVTRVPGIIRRVWGWDTNGIEYYYSCQWRPHPRDHRRVKAQRISRRNAGMR